MGASFSLVSLKLIHSRWVLKSNGLEQRVVRLDGGLTRVHCWAPAAFCKRPEERENKPVLVLLHGFGADGTIAWEGVVNALAKHVWLFLPDLIFFGKSWTNEETMRGRSEVFQADCMVGALRALGVESAAAVVGHSYGGFVAYRMAHLNSELVERVVLLSSGIAMGPASNDELLRKAGVNRVHDILVPPDLHAWKTSLSLVFNAAPPAWLPDSLYMDLFERMGGDREKRLELVEGIVLGKENAPSLPRIHQDALIIRGDEDQIFSVELAYKLKEFLGGEAKVEVIKGVGHVPNLSEPKLVSKMIMQFLKS